MRFYVRVDGSVVQLASRKGTAFLNTYGSNLQRNLSVPLTDRETDTLIWHFVLFSGFAVNEVTDRAHFLEPGGYLDCTAYSGVTVYYMPYS